MEAFWDDQTGDFTFKTFVTQALPFRLVFNSALRRLHETDGHAMHSIIDMVTDLTDVITRDTDPSGRPATSPRGRAYRRLAERVT